MIDTGRRATFAVARVYSGLMLELACKRIKRLRLMGRAVDESGRRRKPSQAVLGLF
jgi:hypothetical protein